MALLQKESCLPWSSHTGLLGVGAELSHHPRKKEQPDDTGLGGCHQSLWSSPLTTLQAVLRDAEDDVGSSREPVGRMVRAWTSG